jgi:hypothetical protein
VAARASFLRETTLSGGVVLRCRADGTRAGLAVDRRCLGVEDVQTLIDRIAARVALGGHQVPDEAVRWLAKLGGYMGRRRDGPPGPEVLWRGLQRLVDLTLMYHVFSPPPSRRKCG